MNCEKCKKPIEKYCDFPGQLCINCHGQKFNNDQVLQKTTAEDLANQFKSLINN